MEYLVVVSHSSVDTWVARQIGTHLESYGGTVFLDAVDIEAGDAYDEVIRERINACRELVAGRAGVVDVGASAPEALEGASTILVLVSANAANSKWAQFEAGAALGASMGSEKRLIPVYLSTRGPDYLPLLRGLESIDLSGLRPEQGGKRVAEYLTKAA